MSGYAFSALREFIHVVPFNPQWGTPEDIEAEVTATPAKKEVAPTKSAQVPQTGRGDSNFDASAFEFKKEALDFMNAPAEVVAGTRAAGPSSKVSAIVLTDDEKKALDDLDHSLKVIQASVGPAKAAPPTNASPLSTAGMRNYFGLPASAR